MLSLDWFAHCTVDASGVNRAEAVFSKSAAMRDKAEFGLEALPLQGSSEGEGPGGDGAGSGGEPGNGGGGCGWRGAVNGARLWGVVARRTGQGVEGRGGEEGWGTRGAGVGVQRIECSGRGRGALEEGGGVREGRGRAAGCGGREVRAGCGWDKLVECVGTGWWGRMGREGSGQEWKETGARVTSSVFGTAIRRADWTAPRISSKSESS